MKGKKGVSCVFLFFKRRLRRQRGSVQWADFTQIWRQWVENAWGEIWFQSLMVKGKEEWRWWWWYIGVHFYSTWFHYCECSVQWGGGGGMIESDENLKKERRASHGAKSFREQDGFQTSAECRQRICFLFRSDQVFFFKWEHDVHAAGWPHLIYCESDITIMFSCCQNSKFLKRHLWVPQQAA